ncbi:MAG TPA: Type 1 glutamine amidotransferase-like domain-containing protein [Actinomycetota bacterium]|nr:Type 1 glutamine amidotransferase-like domain-containing protein [Actinomycetota bacterium]
MGAIALLGSGEFEPWARPVDKWCAEQASQTTGKVLVVPTASAPEGDETFRRWGRMGVDHYRAIGLAPEVLDLRVRADASKDEIVGAVEGARLIFFSGGNPGYLAETLNGTPFWDAVAAAVSGGKTALGGCSAGAAFLGATAPFVSEDSLDHWTDGTKLLPRAYVIVHFDMIDTYVPGLRQMLLDMRPEGTVTVAIDENTALYGDGEHWNVKGAGSVWIDGDGSELVKHPDGSTLDLRLL